MIINLLASKPLPVYGDGKNVRDWLYVIDHCEALLAAFTKGLPGETYNIGGGAERKNIDVVHTLCDLLGRTTGTQRKRWQQKFDSICQRPAWP